MFLRVVLEHSANPEDGCRRLFVFASHRDAEDRFPLLLMASALSGLLGTNTLALQLILGRAEEGPSELNRYLQSSCGVSLRALQEMQRRDAEDRGETLRRISLALDSLGPLAPALLEAVRDVLMQGASLSSRAVWLTLQDGGVALHTVAFERGLQNVSSLGRPAPPSARAHHGVQGGSIRRDVFLFHAVQQVERVLNLGDLYVESGQTLQGSFSGVSKISVASKYSLELGSI